MAEFSLDKYRCGALARVMLCLLPIERVNAEGRLTPKAVIPVDLFGQPADYDRILPIAQKYGLKVLEDGAQGFGGSVRGKPACSFGNMSATSFFPAKPLGCYGDGGAVFTDSDEEDFCFFWGKAVIRDNGFIGDPVSQNKLINSTFP